MLTLSLPVTGTVQAKTKAPACAKSMTCYLMKEDSSDWFLAGYSSYIFINNLASDAVITEIKSSNKAAKGVAMNHAGYNTAPAVAIDRNYDLFGILKPGQKTTITFKVTQNKKTYNLKCKVSFKKVKSPFSSLKVGKKQYASKCVGSCLVKAKQNGKQKVSVRAAKGFKLVSVKACINGKPSKRVKNGLKIDTKKYSGILVIYKITKKPMYYKKVKNWVGKIPGYLYEYCYLKFQ